MALDFGPMKAPARSHVKTIAFTVLCLAVAACHRSPPPQPPPIDSTQAGTPPAQTPVPAKAQPLPQELPAFYTGMLPCADCEGIRYELQLRADQVFFARMTYLGKPAPNAIDRPSGDQKKVTGPSVPATGRASSESIGRIQICIWPSAPIAV